MLGLPAIAMAAVSLLCHCTESVSPHQKHCGDLTNQLLVHKDVNETAAVRKREIKSRFVACLIYLCLLEADQLAVHIIHIQYHHVIVIINKAKHHEPLLALLLSQSSPPPPLQPPPASSFFS